MLTPHCSRETPEQARCPGATFAQVTEDDHLNTGPLCDAELVEGGLIIKNSLLNAARRDQTAYKQFTILLLIISPPYLSIPAASLLPRQVKRHLRGLPMTAR